MRRVALAVALCAAAVVAAGSPAGAQERARFNTTVLGLVPAPGFPAMAYVHPDGRIYAGTYVNMSGSSAPSKVFEYTGGGTRVRSWTVPGQDVAAEQGVQAATSDSRGRLVLLDRSPSRALLLDRRTGDFSTYAVFPDLPLCATGQTAPGCSPSLEDRPAIPNYAAWGPDGSLYVTDYGQAVLWRVPPGGGGPVIWLADRRLDGGMFGTTGIALAADERTLLVAQGSSAGLGALTPSTGKLYSVAIGPNGNPGALRQLWESQPGDLPDGFAIAASGRIYIPLVGLPQQLAVLSPEGRELERFPKEAGSGDNGSAVPFDGPSSARFLGTRLIVANQSPVAGDPAHQALLDVEVRRAGPARADPRTRPQRARDLARVALPAEARTGAARHSHPAAPVRAGDRDRARGEAQAERLRAGGRLQDAQARRRAARLRLPRPGPRGPQADPPAARALPLRAGRPRRRRQRLGPRVPALSRRSLTRPRRRQAGTTTTGVCDRWSSLWGVEPRMAPLIGLSA